MSEQGSVSEMPIVSDERLSIELADALADRLQDGRAYTQGGWRERTGLAWATVYSHMRRRDCAKPRAASGYILLTYFAALGPAFTNRIMRLAGYRVLPLDCGTCPDPLTVVRDMGECIAELAARVRGGIDPAEARDLLPTFEEHAADMTAFVEQLRAVAK